MDRFWVGMQGLLAAVIGSLAVLATGHRSGFAVLVLVGTCAIVWLLCAASFLLRSNHAARAAWRKETWNGLLSGLIGFGAPIALGVIAWRTSRLEGVISSTSAAAFTAAAIALMPAAALASSMVDRYVILPRLFGLVGGEPVWSVPKGLDEAWRRRIAQAWIAHRAICELFIFTSMALVLAIVIVAAGNALSHDKTLPTAFESLGGASVAVGVFGFARPRWAASLKFCLSGQVCLGNWVVGPDPHGHKVSGLAVDVSVDPGVKIIQANKQRTSTSLEHVDLVNALERPHAQDVAWCKRVTISHLLKVTEEHAAVWPAEPAPEQREDQLPGPANGGETRPQPDPG
jgi:hypothetical protein